MLWRSVSAAKFNQTVFLVGVFLHLNVESAEVEVNIRVKKQETF